jgi:hypothetical protein
VLVSGQLRQEAANHTLGYSEPSRWADDWARQFASRAYASTVPSAGALTCTSSSTNIFGNVGVEVELVRMLPIFRFEYSSLAEQLAGVLSCLAPDPTGYPQIDEVYSPTSFSEPAGRQDASADALVRDIIDWLDVTYEELSQISGVGRSTLFHWRNTEGSPRAANNRNIYRVHALASLLVKRFGAAGTQSWLQAGPNRPWDYLIRSDLESVEAMLRSDLFGRRGKNFAARPGIGDEVDLPPLTGPGVPKPLRAKRRPKRGRLGR